MSGFSAGQSASTPCAGRRARQRLPNCRALHLLQMLIGAIDCPGGFRYRPPYPKPTAPPTKLAGKTAPPSAPSPARRTRSSTTTARRCASTPPIRGWRRSPPTARRFILAAMPQPSAQSRRRLAGGLARAAERQDRPRPAQPAPVGSLCRRRRVLALRTETQRAFLSLRPPLLSANRGGAGLPRRAGAGRIAALPGAFTTLASPPLAPSMPMTTTAAWQAWVRSVDACRAVAARLMRLVRKQETFWRRSCR